MNWVGGVRNRLKTKDEKCRQKEFFEKMKYGSRVRRLKRTHDSPKNTSLPTSLDLLSLQAADYSAKKFRQSDPEQSSKIKVKKIEMDRSRGMFPYHHHHQELPMSPDETPSKLQLQEPDESPLLSCLSYEGHLQTANSIYNINQSSEMLKKSASYMMKPEEQVISDSHHEFVQSSNPFHSTPITKVDDAPLQPLKHQGKHFEDLFFSFMPPGCDNENVSLGPMEKLPSALNDGTSDDWKYADGFEYSPLSFIPSESSQSDTASSSQITVSQDSQQEDPRNMCQSENMKIRCNNADTLTNDEFNGSSMSNMEDEEIPGETNITQKKNPDSKSNSEKVDLICKETVNFLSPCNKLGDESKSTSGKSSKTGDRQGLDVLKNSQDIGVSNLTSNEKQEEQTRERNPVKCCPPQSLTNSFKWKAFVSGQTLSENSTSLNKERNVKQTPTKTMSSVCQQVLQEVMQLDRELIQKSPYPLRSTSKSGSLTSMMGFTNVPLVTKHKPKMEEFSLSYAKGTEFANVQTTNTKHPMEYGEQQVPDQTDQHITSHSLQIHSSPSDSSEQQDTDDEENSTIQHRNCNQQSQENKECQGASGMRNPAYCGKKSGGEKTPAEPIDYDCQEMTPCQDDLCSTHYSDTLTSTQLTCDSIIHNKATQCDINTVTTESKETQYKLKDCSESLCDEKEASAIQENDVNTSDPSLPCDPYDGCKIC